MPTGIEARLYARGAPSWQARGGTGLFASAALGYVTAAPGAFNDPRGGSSFGWVARSPHRQTISLEGSQCYGPWQRDPPKDESLSSDLATPVQMVGCHGRGEKNQHRAF